MYVDRAMYNMKRAVQNFFRELLELLFNAAALVIDTLRTFFLIVLSILGPVSFAISCWDGFQASLSQWFVRYISIYLWLPVSDLFSSCLLYTSESGISFLPAKVAPCPEKPGKAALRAGCREIIILAALAVFFHGKPCGIPNRGGKAFRK